MPGIIRGGDGDLALKDVPGVTPSDLIGRRGEMIARKYEAQFPRVVVVSDYELFTDQDIALMPPAQAEQARHDRAALERRREMAAAVPPTDAPLRSGDPDRIREVLSRARRDMANLDILHPEYERLFRDFANQINLLEDACGEHRTVFAIATKEKPAKPKEPSHAEKAILQGQVKAYKEMGTARRAEAIAAMIDPVLLRAFLEVETETPIRDAIVKKLFALGAT